MRPLSRPEIVSIIVVAVILCISGFICGTFHSLNSTLVFSKEINLIQLASLLSTVFGIFVISIYFDRHKESTKLQRDMLLKRIETLYESISAISPLIENGPVDLCEINSSLKKISIGIKRIEKIIRTIGIKCASNSDSMDLHKKLRILMTDTPQKARAKSEPADIVVGRGKVSYSQSRKEQIDDLLDKIESNLLNHHLAITRPS